MIKLNIYAALLAAVSLSFIGAEGVAQIRDDLAQPAELPPSTYEGRQYVDSRGCIYIRAGIDGNVTWVPRVDRNRQVICGRTSGTTQAAETAPAPAPVAEAAAPAVAAPAPQPAARPVVRQPAPAAAPQPARKVQTRTVRRAPAPRVEAPARRPVARKTSPVEIDGPVVIVDKNRRVIHSTPDGVRVYSGKSGQTYVTGRTVIAPKAAYERGASTKVRVPQGYEPAFKDGRHSTTRAHQTLDGRRKMLLIWTNTVPRRLIDKYTGEEVSRYFPELRYPYRSMRQQRAAMVSSRSQAPKTVRRAAPVMAASHRFIQIGSFSSRAKAEGAIRRLQGAGMPVSVNEYTSSGTHYYMVLAGPFQRQDRLSSALNVVRNRIGYRSASLRN